MKSVKDKIIQATHFTGAMLLRVVVMALCFAVTYVAAGQDIPDAPNPPRLVNDFAHVMTAAQVNTLEHKLDQYDDSTSTQIAIVTIETLNGQDIGEFGAELLQKWGVGSKKNHNGVVIAIAMKEHKVTIRTGYGVEEKLGAIICDRIIKETITPNLKQGKYYEAFDAATTEMIQRLAGTYQGDGNNNNKPTSIPVWLIIAIILFILIVLPRFFGGGGTYGGGGFTGGMIGGMLGGGGFGGGDSGGGGFGGFGGGEASGGGASGSW